jgi:pimeloyl-ACP methyl ester carboxylesterase
MTELAFDDTGNGVPLVFLHGIAMQRSAWAPVVELLADRYRCVNIDLAGHGDSPRTGAYDVFSQADAVGELIGDLGLDLPVLVGHSYGAFTATLAGAYTPVRGVVNVDQELDTAAFKLNVSPLESRLRGEDFASAFGEFSETLRPDLVPDERRALATMHPDSDVVLEVWTTVFDTPVADLNAMLEPVLSSYPVPYLVIYGSRISAEEQRLLELVPDVEIEQWEGLGHFVQLVDPERTAGRIAHFVDSIER